MVFTLKPFTLVYGVFVHNENMYINDEVLACASEGGNVMHNSSK